MKQVNIRMSDDTYKLLIKEAARRQLVSGEIMRPTSLAGILVIESLNGKHDDKQQASQDNEQGDEQVNEDDKPDDEQVPANTPTKDNPYADLKF